MGKRLNHKNTLRLKKHTIEQEHTQVEQVQRLQPEEEAYLLEGRVGKEELRAKLKTAFRHSEEARKTVSKRKFRLEVVGVALSVLGWALCVVSCALPMWRVSAFIGANIVTAQVYWEGLWMSCVFQSTGQMQCKVYDSMLALPQDLQAARALTVVSIIVGLLALLISIVGAKCTNCIEDEVAKARVMAASGGAFIAAALAQIVPVSWSAHSIIVEFYSPLILSGQKMEIGAALYLGWAAAALLLIGGSILCCSCPPKEEKPTRYTIPPQSRIAYSAAPRSVAQSSYNRKDYV
ncbi:putative claudin-4-like [Scophthalmus maximus]|uniref:Putative claudin-4-like n=1 Tax=Scophthalmus maximus TaxID=52904 RepID=A0A2U9B7W4_SCOMX|nr:putative claudin-4-like [Scophthalmus maximus]